MASALFSERRIASMNVELFSALFDESRFDATSSLGFSPTRVNSGHKPKKYEEN